MSKKLIPALIVALGVATSAHAAPPPPGVSGLDQEYLKSSIQGDMFEMQGAKIALQRSTDSKLRGYARMLFRDHRQSVHEAVALAHSLGVQSIEMQPTKSQTWELKAASRMGGGTFHRWYLLLEAHDHKDDISQARDERDNGANYRVTAAARQELPTLFKHLKVAERLIKSGA